METWRTEIDVAYRWIPRLVLAVAAVHVLLGLTAAPLRGMLQDGLFDTVGSDASREAAVWFLVTGLALLMIGESTREQVRVTGRLPRSLAPFLLGSGALICLVIPASGAWALLGLGVWALGARGRSGAVGGV